MRFYAVCTEAIQLTNRALQQLDQSRRGSRQPSRALRVATLYGHLQTRTNASGEVRLALRDLAAAWNLQPRLLREDLSDLQALGWLSYRCDWRGTVIRLRQAVLPQGDGEPVAEQTPAEPEEASRLAPMTPVPLEEPEPSGAVAPSQSDDGLIARFTETYNRYRPSSWPAYSPRGDALAARVRRAIRHAGNEEALLARLAQALGAMPEFWRTTYPQGRSGADCITALLSADRKAAGLGVEFWHVFCWGSQGQTAGSAGPYTQRLNGGIGGNTPKVGSGRMAAIHHPDFVRAQQLLVWGDHAWRCQGMEAFDLPASEKQRLAELLEAAGLGELGKAAEQFAQEVRR